MLLHPREVIFLHPLELLVLIRPGLVKASEEEGEPNLPHPTGVDTGRQKDHELDVAGTRDTRNVCMRFVEHQPSSLSRAAFARWSAARAAVFSRASAWRSMLAL